MKVRNINKSTGEDGFSLMELMIAIAIAGIIAAIAVPALIENIVVARNQKTAEEVNNTFAAINKCASSDCEFNTYLSMNNEMVVQCTNCTDPMSEYEGKPVFVASKDMVIDVKQTPMWGDFLISAFHEKGNRTYCLHSPPVYRENFPGNDLMPCDSAMPPF